MYNHNYTIIYRYVGSHECLQVVVYTSHFFVLMIFYIAAVYSLCMYYRFWKLWTITNDNCYNTCTCIYIVYTHQNSGYRITAIACTLAES